MIAYHFTSDKLRDGRPVPAIGEMFVHEGPIEICQTGLHASKHPLDAFEYAPGSVLHKVEADYLLAYLWNMPETTREYLTTLDPAAWAEFLLRVEAEFENHNPKKG